MSVNHLEVRERSQKFFLVFSQIILLLRILLTKFDGIRVFCNLQNIEKSNKVKKIFTPS